MRLRPLLAVHERVGRPEPCLMLFPCSRWLFVFVFVVFVKGVGVVLFVLGIVFSGWTALTSSGLQRYGQRAVRAVAAEKRATEMMSPRCLERFICRHGVSSDACCHGLFARFHVVVAGKPPPPPPWVAFQARLPAP